MHSPWDSVTLVVITLRENHIFRPIISLSTLCKMLCAFLNFHVLTYSLFSGRLVFKSLMRDRHGLHTCPAAFATILQYSRIFWRQHVSWSAFRLGDHSCPERVPSRHCCLEKEVGQQDLTAAKCTRNKTMQRWKEYIYRIKYHIPYHILYSILYSYWYRMHYLSYAILYDILYTTSNVQQTISWYHMRYHQSIRYSMFFYCSCQ